MKAKEKAIAYERSREKARARLHACRARKKIAKQKEIAK